MCCVKGNIYLVGHDRRMVTEYNPRTNTWRDMPSLQKERWGHTVSTLDNKIFVLGGGYDSATCEMLDLSEDDPQWRYIPEMNSIHFNASAVVVEKNAKGWFIRKHAKNGLQSRSGCHGLS